MTHEHGPISWSCESRSSARWDPARSRRNTGTGTAPRSSGVRPSLGFGAFMIGALAAGSLPLIAVTGAAIAAFGVALSADYRGLAAGLRQAQWRLSLSAQTYAVIGRGVTLIGLLWIAVALTRLA